MNFSLWIVQGLLSAVFAAFGTVKLIKSKEVLQPQMAYMEDLSGGTVKFIGAMELLAAIGLIIPGITGIAPVLTPLAATGLVVLMLLATVTHLRRKEFAAIRLNAVLGGLALFVAIGRI